MRIHKEGRMIILNTTLIIVMLNVVIYNFLAERGILTIILSSILFVFWILVIQFFRNPKRNIIRNDKQILAPVDGKVVIIEETEEPEYFKGKRLQVSIFMSPLNVHVSRYPLGGDVVFSKYHPGKYLVAWHPKSSTLNERTTVVVKNKNFGEVLFRQIAGAVARRIVLYPKAGDVAIQGEDFGFIKFGSRLDIFLPVGTKVNIELDQVVKGGKTIIAEM